MEPRSRTIRFALKVHIRLRWAHLDNDYIQLLRKARIPQGSSLGAILLKRDTVTPTVTAIDVIVLRATKDAQRILNAVDIGSEFVKTIAFGTGHQSLDGVTVIGRKPPSASRAVAERKEAAITVAVLDMHEIAAAEGIE